MYGYLKSYQDIFWNPVSIDWRVLFCSRLYIQCGRLSVQLLILLWFCKSCSCSLDIPLSVLILYFKIQVSPLSQVASNWDFRIVCFAMCGWVYWWWLVEADSSCWVWLDSEWVRLHTCCTLSNSVHRLSQPYPHSFITYKHHNEPDLISPPLSGGAQ